MGSRFAESIPLLSLKYDVREKDMQDIRVRNKVEKLGRNSIAVNDAKKSG